MNDKSFPMADIQVIKEKEITSTENVVAKLDAIRKVIESPVTEEERLNVIYRIVNEN